MKVYLDIDGTMIHEDMGDMWGKPAAGLEEFIIALRPYDTHWLTTHCMNGGSIRAVEMMKRVVPEALHPDIERIKPTAWEKNKTEALDWDADFIWFDNDIFDEEYKDLEKCNENQSVLQVDLKANPKQLEEITRDVLC